MKCDRCDGTKDVKFSEEFCASFCVDCRKRIEESELDMEGFLELGCLSEGSSEYYEVPTHILQNIPAVYDPLFDNNRYSSWHENSEWGRSYSTSGLTYE